MTRPPFLDDRPVLSDHPVEVGQRTEAVILAEFVKRGYRVLMPFGHNHRYDFVLDLGDDFVRVQCKTGRLRRGVIRFNTVSTRTNTREIHRRDYRGQVDVFAVHCRATAGVYVVPVAEGVTDKGYLRIAPTANCQEKGINWASDFELPPCASE